MNFQDYEAECARTTPPIEESRFSVCLMAMGLAGETGELVDALKKDIFHDVPMTIAAVESELGDILWYLTGVARIYGISLERVAQNNVAKLRKRYPDGFKLGGGIRE